MCQGLSLHTKVEAAMGESKGKGWALIGVADVVDESLAWSRRPVKAVKAGGCRTKVVSLARLGGTDGGGRCSRRR